MSLLSDTQHCGLRMRREYRARFPRHRKSLVSDQSTCIRTRAVMHIGIANPRGEENVPGFPGAYATRNFVYLVRGPLAALEVFYGGKKTFIIIDVI